MIEINKLRKKLIEIKDLGWVDNQRPSNKDGGIGNTFEDLLGIKENNNKAADYIGIEIKCKRELNSSYISLFSKSPSSPYRANTYLREKYGEIRDENHPEKKKLYASIFGHRDSIVYGKYKMKLKVNKRSKVLELIIKDLEGNQLDKVNWSFESLEKASHKIKSLLLVLTETRRQNNKTQFYYSKAELFTGFDFNKFLESIKSGYIQFDIRIGVYSSGKSYGKTHDHGSGFRIKHNNLIELYKRYIKV